MRGSSGRPGPWLAVVCLLCLPACLPYKPTLKMEHTVRTIPATVLVRPFADASPPEDKQAVSEWSLAQTGAGVMEGDLGALVTKAVIADFSATAVFRSIHRNQAHPDLVLSGTIRRFFGEVSLPSWLRFPGMSWMAHAYWVPFQEWEGEVDLEVSLATPGGRVLATYRGRADYAEVATREGVYWSMPLYPPPMPGSTGLLPRRSSRSAITCSATAPSSPD